mmetsp:Transcript_13680/g.27209  ORF Transcript_13680/g.27209 Transcript_13680/m.27209 type:complete len:200 (+) Transcript_13680:2464-3063(+)
MDGISPPLLVLFCHEEPIGLRHDDRVGGLHGEDEVVEVILSADLRKFLGRLHHSSGSIAIEGEDTRTQGTMVCSDSDGSLVLFASLQKGDKQLLDSLPPLFEIVPSVKNLFLKFLHTVRKVPGVHPNLLECIRHQERHLRVEVDICHKRDIVSLLKEPFPDLHARLCLLIPLHRQPAKVCACIRNSHHLIYTTLDVLCV